MSTGTVVAPGAQRPSYADAARGKICRGLGTFRRILPSLHSCRAGRLGDAGIRTASTLGDNQ